MIAILAGLCVIALFVSLVMLFGREPRRPKRWPEAGLVIEPRRDNLEAFRQMVRNAEQAAEEQAAAVSPARQPSE